MEPGKRVEEPRAVGSGREAVLDRVEIRATVHVRTQPWQRVQVAPLAAPVLQQHVCGKPVEPRQRALVHGPEPAAALECDPEDIGGELVGSVASGPPLQVAVDRREVPVEEHAEQLGLLGGPCEERRVGASLHRSIIPERLSRVHAASDDEVDRAAYTGHR